MTVRPNTLTAKMTIRTISGVRMRRRIRKTVAEACEADAAATRSTARRSCRSSSPSSICFQKVSRGLPMTASDHPRWKETVSTTSSTTETMLASSAPPDRETTLAVHASFMPAVDT